MFGFRHFCIHASKSATSFFHFRFGAGFGEAIAGLGCGVGQHQGRVIWRRSPGGIRTAARESVLDDLFASDGTMILPRRRIHFSTLVLAVGIEENDFGTPGAREHGLFFQHTRAG
jgi:hypothetical protein